MATPESNLLQGLVEMDETYIGSKSRENVGNNKKARGTNKTAVVGMLEHSGEVKTEVIRKDDKLNFSNLKKIYDKNVDKFVSIFITDEYIGYSPITNSEVSHSVISHQEALIKKV